MLYLIIIIASAALIALGNFLFYATPDANNLPEIFLSVLIGVIAVIAEDGISALLIRRLTPKSWFSPERRSFAVSKKERDIYRSLGIKKWKNAIPELGLFTGFSKSELKNTSDKKYLSRFLLEANYGVVIHLANGLLGFVIMFLPPCSSPSIWIPIFCVNFVLSLLPTAILRYTSYTLLKLYKRSKKAG